MSEKVLDTANFIFLKMPMIIPHIVIDTVAGIKMNMAIEKLLKDPENKRIYEQGVMIHVKDNKIINVDENGKLFAE